MPSAFAAHPGASRNIPSWEITMFRRSFDSLLGAALVAALLTFTALSELRRQILIRWRLSSRRSVSIPLRTPPANPLPGEFQHERAIEAYETLIDALLTEHRA
jgi:hypothetical protein